MTSEGSIDHVGSWDLIEVLSGIPIRATLMPHGTTLIPYSPTPSQLFPSRPLNSGIPLHNPINTTAIACLFVPLWLGTPIAYAPVTESQVLASRFGVFRFHWLATDRLSSYSYLQPHYASLFLTLSDLHRASDTSTISPMKRPWKKRMSHTTSSVLFLPVWDLALGCTLRCAHINPRAPILMGTSYFFLGGCLVSLRTAGA